MGDTVKDDNIEGEIERSTNSKSTKHDSSAAFTIENAPLPVLQALYREITDKSESLSKAFSVTRITKKADIEQLCIKFQQIAGQFNVVGANCTFIVRHTNGFVNSFSSLPNFLQYDENYPTAIESISVEFGVLIKNPVSNKNFDYKIDVTVRSVDVNDDTSQSEFLELMGAVSVYAKITYADYVIARTFLAAIEEWVDGLEQIKPNKFLIHMKAMSFPNRTIAPYDRMIAIISRAVALYASYQLMDKMVDFSNLRSLVMFFFLSSFIFLITSRASDFIFDLFEEKVRRYRLPNFIVINRGDLANLNEYKSQKKSICIRALLTASELSLVIILNLLSSKIYDLIK